MGVRCAVGLKWGGKHEPEIPMKPGAKVHLSLSRSMASIQSFGYSDTEVARPKGTASDRPSLLSPVPIPLLAVLLWPHCPLRQS